MTRRPPTYKTSKKGKQADKTIPYHLVMLSLVATLSLRCCHSIYQPLAAEKSPSEDGGIESRLKSKSPAKAGFTPCSRLKSKAPHPEIGVIAMARVLNILSAHVISNISATTAKNLWPKDAYPNTAFAK